MFRLFHRTARATRRLLGLDRERRWNREYARGGWEWLHSLEELAHHAVLAGYVNRLAPNGRLLDVGCGDGVFHEQLVGRHYASYLGVDFAEPIQRAESKADEKTRFVVADMNDFEPDGLFDAIVFNESLYFLWDVADGLSRYEKHLASRGVFVVSMHVKEANEARWAVVRERYQVLDAVSITNARGTRWTVKAFAPRGYGSDGDRSDEPSRP